MAAPAGLLVGLLVSVPFSWRFGLILGWDVTALIMLLWLWPAIWPMDAAQTKSHAVREDSSRRMTDLVLIGASIASVLAVALVILGGRDKSDTRDLLVVLAVASIMVSWTLVHSIFATRYARIYYTEPQGGIDFKNDDDPMYTDFAYVAFTLGMTFQVADTDLQSSVMRRTALRHALISYVFGAVIIAATINLVAGLGS